MDLRYLTLKLTNNCNLACTMCGQVYSGERNDMEIEIETIKECINSIDTLEHVYLFGGEPLLYSKFKILLALLHEKMIPTLITTNGVLLDEYAADIVKYGVRDLDISIDSHKKDIYENIRKKGDFNSLINNIRILFNTRQECDSIFPRIGFSCVILPENCNEMIEFYEFIQNKFPEADRIIFEFPMKTNVKIGQETDLAMQQYFGCECKSWKWFSNNHIIFTKEQIDSINHQLKELQKYKKVHIQGSFETYINEQNTGTLYNDKKCDYPFSSISILPGGQATFCTDFPDIDLGNLHRISINDIWKGTNAELFRNYMMQKGCLPICESCTHFHDIIRSEKERF